METKKAKILAQRKAYQNGEINIREISDLADSNYNYVVQVFTREERLEKINKEALKNNEPTSFKEPATSFEDEIEHVDISDAFEPKEKQKSPDIINLPDGRIQVIYQSKLNEL